MELLAPEYTRQVFDHKSLKALVRQMLPRVRKLKKALKFNTLAVCGHSGIVIGSIISYRTGIPLLIVRKTGDKCNDSHEINGQIPSKCKYLIIDDLIDTGRTIRRIIKKIKSATYKETIPVGILLYFRRYSIPFQYSPNKEPLTTYYIQP